MNTWTTVIALAAALWISSVAEARQPDRPQQPNNAPRRETRDTIKSMNILDRPNRRGHFYGNTMRRRYYRAMHGQR